MSLSIEVSKKVSLSDLERQFQGFGECSFLLVDDKPLAQFANKADADTAKKAIDEGKLEGVEVHWAGDKGQKREPENIKKLIQDALNETLPKLLKESIHPLIGGPKEVMNGEADEKLMEILKKMMTSYSNRSPQEKLLISSWLGKTPDELGSYLKANKNWEAPANLIPIDVINNKIGDNAKELPPLKDEIKPQKDNFVPVEVPKKFDWLENVPQSQKKVDVSPIKNQRKEEEEAKEQKDHHIPDEGKISLNKIDLTESVFVSMPKKDKKVYNCTFLRELSSIPNKTLTTSDTFVKKNIVIKNGGQDTWPLNAIIEAKGVSNVEPVKVGGLPAGVEKTVSIHVNLTGKPGQYTIPIVFTCADGGEQIQSGQLYELKYAVEGNKIFDNKPKISVEDAKKIKEIKEIFDAPEEKILAAIEANPKATLEQLLDVLMN